MSSSLHQDFGTMSLHDAVERQDITIVKYLIDQGCNVNAQNATGDTPLILAVQKRNEAIVDVLLRNNGDVLATNRSQANALEITFRACLRYAPMRSINANFIILEKMLEKITRDLSTNERGMMQLLRDSSELVKLIVVAGGSVDLADFVLKNGYPVNFHEPMRGLTALHCSVIFSKIDNAKLLLAHFAGSSAIDRYQYSALFYYTDDCQDVDENSHLLKSMLSRATSLHLRNERGYTDFEYLLMYGNEKTVKTALKNAMKSGVDVRATRFHGDRSVLHVLIDNANEGVFRVFDELAIRFDASSLTRLDSDNHTALMSAARRSNWSAFRYLFKHSDITESTSPSVLTLMFYEAKALGPTDPKVLNNMAEVTKLLLKIGADAQFVTDRGATLLSDLANQRDNPNTEIMNPSAKIIVAHLALLSTQGKSLLTDRSRSDIQNEPLFEAHFVSCTRQLEAMKNVKVHGSVTLFKLLTESDKKVMGYACNRDLILEFNSIMKRNHGFDSFYLESLEKKMSRAIYGNELYEKAAPILEALTGLYNDAYHAIIYEILSYLSFRDLQNVSLVRISRECITRRANDLLYV